MANAILSKGSREHFYHNWSRSVQCRPEIYFEPSTVEELRQILAAARVNDKKVKVVGRGHSFSKLPTTQGYMISLAKFNRIKSIDRRDDTVTAEAGITLTDLNQRLDTEGLALTVLPVVTDVTLGGAISTGSNGSGSKFKTMSSYVLELELLVASGEIIHLTRTKDPECFSAACLSLGALGILLSIKVQCEPKYDLTLVTYGVQLNDLLENLSVHLEASDYYSFLWFPHTENAVACHTNRTTKPHSKPGSRWSAILGYHMVQFFLWIGTVLPFLSARISQYFSSRALQRNEITSGGNMLLTLDPLVPHTAHEWAVPRSKAALVMFELKQWIADNKFPAHFPVVVRFSEADNILLSPAYGMDVCYINVAVYKPYGITTDHSKLVDAFSQMALRAGGRMHWAKMHEQVYPQVQDMYPGLQSFLRIRRQLDPEGRFLNDDLCRMFSLT